MFENYFPIITLPLFLFLLGGGGRPFPRTPVWCAFAMEWSPGAALFFTSLRFFHFKPFLQIHLWNRKPESTVSMSLRVNFVSLLGTETRPAADSCSLSAPRGQAGFSPRAGGVYWEQRAVGDANQQALSSSCF